MRLNNKKLEESCREYGYAFYCNDSTVSTMLIAPGFDLKDHVYTTEHQVDGVGRNATFWQMEKESDLAFTIHKYLDYTPHPFLAVNVGFAILKLLKAKYDLPCQFKWPNDIYLHDQKLAGILIQSEHSNNHIYLKIGVGINVNSTPTEFTSISKALGRIVDRSELLESLVAIISTALDFESTPNILTEDDYLHGHNIEFMHNNQLIKGKYCGFDQHGLKVEQNDEIVYFNDAEFVRIK